jgi:hypothetical protein
MFGNVIVSVYEPKQNTTESGGISPEAKAGRNLTVEPSRPLASFVEGKGLALSETPVWVEVSKTLI